MLYLYDGTFDGFLTALARGGNPSAILAALPEQVDFEEQLPVPTDKQTAKDFREQVKSLLGSGGVKVLQYLYLSEAADIGPLALDYLKLAEIHKEKVHLLAAHPTLCRIRELSHKVTFESHRFKGYIRFSLLENGIYYAAIEPDHNILYLLMDHFTERFTDQPFMLHDVKRCKALLHRAGDTAAYLAPVPETFAPVYHGEEAQVPLLFRTFFEALAIESRKNLKLQRQFVPLRYRKHMVEFHSK